MAIFKTFKASIETKYGGHLKDGDVFFFHPDNPYTHEGIVHNLNGVVFEFSQEDIMFSEQQKIKYGEYIQLHPVHGYGDTFSDGIKYELIREHIKGKTKYSIKVGSQKADLVLNWCNRQKIEWVNGRKVNWKIWSVLVPSLALIAYCIFNYLNYIKPTATTPTIITDTLPKKNTNQLHLHGVDTTKKIDGIKIFANPDTTKH